MRNQSWTDEKRDILLKDLTRRFFSARAFFNDLKEHTQRYGIRFDGFHFWVGTEMDKGVLWEMKDMAQVLWGEARSSKEPEGAVLCWMLGALFHEAMKLKENAYMLDKYNSTFPSQAMELLSVRGAEDGAFSTVQEKRNRFFEDTRRECTRSMRRVDCLFESASDLLLHILEKEKENPLLIRYLVEEAENSRNQPEANQGYSPQEVLDRLFPAEIDRAWYLAGESYLDGGWFDEARASFEKALEINPESPDARAGLHLLERRIDEIDTMTKKEMEIMGNL